jgi:hypothetical protein
MRTSEAITLIIEATAGRTGWISVSEVADQTGLTAAELAEAITELMQDEDFHATTEPLGFRLTARDRELAPVVDGEPRHLISWS